MFLSDMKIIAIALILIGIFLGANYSITGEVVAEGVEKAPGIFERIWDFFKGFFVDEEVSVNTTAKVAVEILSSGSVGFE